MTRPTIRRVEIRARDLQRGDIILDPAPRSAEFWREVDATHPQLTDAARLVVRFVDGEARVVLPLDLVTLQKENGS